MTYHDISTINIHKPWNDSPRDVFMEPRKTRRPSTSIPRDVRQLSDATMAHLIWWPIYPRENEDFQ